MDQAAPPSTQRYTITLDDDPIVHRLVEAATNLRSLAFTSAAAFTRRAQRLSPAAVFVDVHLGQGSNGLDLLPQIREWWPFTPILVVTASPGEDVIGLALAAGANDYLRKPFNGRELVARLHARTVEMNERARRQTLNFGDVQIDTVYRRLSGPKGTLFLGEIDGRLMIHLAQATTTIIPRDELKRFLWGGIKVSNNALDKRLSDLRLALRDVGSTLALTSIYGQGVRLAVKAAGGREDAA